MVKDYLEMGVVAAFSAILSSAATVMGFKPRLARLETDVLHLKEKKVNKDVFVEVKAHIDTKFETQKQWLKSVDSKLDVIAQNIERRGEPR